MDPKYVELCVLTCTSGIVLEHYLSITPNKKTQPLVSFKMTTQISPQGLQARVRATLHH
jgi:hypothetical protein